MKKLVTLCVFILFTFFSISHAQNCNWQVTVQVTNPSCVGAKDGKAEVYINGFPATLNQADYLWSTSWDMPSVNKLRAGVYTVSVHDQINSCIDIINFSVIDPIFPSVQLQVVPAHCDKEGSVTITVPSTNDWYIKWVDGESGEPEGTDKEISYSRNLPAGIHGYYIIIDHCNQYYEVTIPQIAMIQIVPSWADPNNTTLGTNVTVLVAVSGGVSPYLYEWYVESSPHKVFSNDDELNASVAGTYILKITDALGCRKTSEKILIINTNPNPVPNNNVKNAYPNPATSLVNIPMTRATQIIELVDVQGKVLQSFDAKGREMIQIDISNYPGGSYFVKFFNQENLLVKTDKVVFRH